VSIPAAAAIGIIAVAELFCTSLWFSANGAAAELLRGWGLAELTPRLWKQQFAANPQRSDVDHRDA
jgi:hypothetical protein